MDENFMEKRLSARITGNFNIYFSDNKDDRVEVHAIDLSSSGIRFKSTKNIPLFREISFDILLPQKDSFPKTSFKCSAIVVRSEKSHHGESYNIALTFIDMDETGKKSLSDFLEVAANV